MSLGCGAAAGYALAHLFGPVALGGHLRHCRAKLVVDHWRAHRARDVGSWPGCFAGQVSSRRRASSPPPPWLAAGVAHGASIVGPCADQARGRADKHDRTAAGLGDCATCRERDGVVSLVNELAVSATSLALLGIYLPNSRGVHLNSSQCKILEYTECYD